ncbi:MAG: FecR family protein [Parcubacteria group bacterium]
MTGPADLATEDLDHTAARWYSRVRSGAMSAQEEAAFEAWLDADPQHRAAYDAIDLAWGALGLVRDHPRVMAMRETLPPEPNRFLARPWVRRAVAACAAAVIAGAGLSAAWLVWRPSDELANQAFRTGVGQKATINLPDGTEVTLNTGTVLRTRADHDRRLVYLDQGQAFFRVAHDKSHPFIVHAAGRTVTAIGTAFDVRVDHGRFSVTLVEGKVRVEQPVAPAKAPQAAAPVRSVQSTDMVAGSELVAAADQQWTIAPTDIVKATSWVHDQLIFEREPLSQVVDEMNRYSVRKIVIADARVGRTLVSGNFRPGDVESFARALEAYRYARISADTPDGIELSQMEAK